MKIFVTGTRGIPNVQGGVETHCEELYPRLVQMGHEVILAYRKGYLDTTQVPNSEYRGIKLVGIPAVKKKSLEAFFHTFLAVIEARKQKVDLVHIHAIGPSIVVPFARFLGLKVVVTNHGPDYDRQKWGKIAKFILHTGERWGTKFASQVIVISEPIRQSLRKQYQANNLHLIFNGVNRAQIALETDYLEEMGILPGRYLFAAGRFVPEKGFTDLINAWSKLRDKPQLVIAGDADHETNYSRELKKLAAENGVILTGFVKGKKLNQLFSHARLFVMPSYHEGLPIALLEALSYGLDTLVSDIPANTAVELFKECYFETANVNALSDALERKLQNTIKPDYSKLLKKYDWELIANQTEQVYKICVQAP